MEGYRRKPRRDTVHREVGGCQTEVNERIELRGRLALINEVKQEKTRDLRGVERSTRWE